MSADRPPIVDRAGSTPPLVSVVVPTRHRADLLAQCVSSILAQTVGDLEVVVVVDGPDPETIEFLSNVGDERLTYVTHPESRGVSNARNTGIDRATGQWVAFCDDDDIWAPTKLAAQLCALDALPTARWAIAGEVRVNPSRGRASYTEPMAPEGVAAALIHTNVVPGGCSGVIADRRLVIELGAFDPHLSMLADHDLWIRLNWNSVPAVAAEPLVGYRDHGTAMTRRLRNVEQELDMIRNKYGDQLAHSGRPFPSDRFYVWTYRRTFGAGDWKGGLGLLVRSRRFGIVVSRWLWGRAMRRLGLTRTVADPLQQQPRMVTVTELPWLDVMLGADAATHNDAPARRHGRRTPRRGST